MARLLDLPAELLMVILRDHGLSGRDIRSCSKTCPSLRRVASTSELQYLLMLEAFGKLANASANANTNEPVLSSVARMRQLLATQITPWSVQRRCMTFSVDFADTGNPWARFRRPAVYIGDLFIHGVDEGVYNDEYPTVLRALRIPSSSHATTYQIGGGGDHHLEEAFRLDFTNFQGRKDVILVDVGVSLERNLMVIVCRCTPEHDEELMTCFAIFRTVDNPDLPHPLAFSETYDLLTELEVHHNNLSCLYFAARIDFCGENVAFVVVFDDGDAETSCLKVMDWQSGTEKLLYPEQIRQHDPGMQCYFDRSRVPGVVFLREDLLLMPEAFVCPDRGLEVAYIPSTAAIEAANAQGCSRKVHRILSFELPELVHDENNKTRSFFYHIDNFGCSPSFRMVSNESLPHLFSDSAGKSGPVMNDPEKSIVVLAFLGSRASDRPTMHGMMETDTHDFRMVLHRHALMEFIPNDLLDSSSQMSFPPGVSRRDDSRAEQEFIRAMRRISWAEWGPSTARLLHHPSGRRLSSSFVSGQRFVERLEDSNEVHIYDFNPFTVKWFERANPENIPIQYEIFGTGVNQLCLPERLIPPEPDDAHRDRTCYEPFHDFESIKETNLPCVRFTVQSDDPKACGVIYLHEDRYLEVENGIDCASQTLTLRY